MGEVNELRPEGQESSSSTDASLSDHPNVSSTMPGLEERVDVFERVDDLWFVADGRPEALRFVFRRGNSSRNDFVVVLPKFTSKGDGALHAPRDITSCSEGCRLCDEAGIVGAVKNCN